MQKSQTTAGVWSNLYGWLRRGKREDDRQAPIDLTVCAIEPLYDPPARGNAESFLRSSEHLFPDRTPGPLLSLSRACMQAMVGHAESNLELEQGGICVGRVQEGADDQRLMIVVEHAITTNNGGFIHGPASLTFTTDAWRSMIEQATRDHPDLRVVGWYHTHPGMSVFLSSMDLFIHNHFFPEPWHIAIVLDPVARSIGAFCRDRSSRELLEVQLMKWEWELRVDAVPAVRPLTAVESRHDP